MTKTIVALVSILFLVAVTAGSLAAAATKSPMSVGGFALGKKIDEYNIKPDENFLKEVIVPDLAGFRKGFLTYGTCAHPGEIIRIKLKYEDKSQKFYEQLLKRFKKEFGSKPKYIGDSFNNYKAWKWGFTGQDGERITLVLQHNLRDADESIGNSVKLSLPDRFNLERTCYNDKVKEQGGGTDGEPQPDWQQLLPN